MKEVVTRSFGFVLFALVCAYSLYKQMQIVAIVALVGGFAMIFKHTAKRIIDLGVALLANARLARLGSLEVELSKDLIDYSEKIGPQAGWVRILLSQLTSDDVGLLLTIAQVKRYPATGALKTGLRTLRARGLIEHDQPTMSASSHVWVSKLGREFANILRRSRNAEHTAPRTDDDSRGDGE